MTITVISTRPFKHATVVTHRLLPIPEAVRHVFSFAFETIQFLERQRESEKNGDWRKTLKHPLKKKNNEHKRIISIYIYICIYVYT